MIKIMFVCHGNICRSPMAEFVMKDMVRKAGLADEFYIASSAVSREEIGNIVYPPAREMLAAHGISCKGKRAVQLTRSDYDEYDYIIAMDRSNLRNIDRIIGSDTEGKVHLLLGFAGRSESVADPWYTDDFDTAYRDIAEGCSALLKKLKDEL